MYQNEFIDIFFTGLGLVGVLTGARISISIHKKKSTLNGQWRLFSCLISIFIAGYIFFIIDFVYTASSLHSQVLSLIFLFGGIFVFLTMNLFKNSMGKIESAQKLVHSIDELRRTAEHDDLTGLYNRKFFEKYLNEVLALCRITDKQFGLLFIDVNNFKFYNDNFGHLCGDQVLISIAKYFNSFFRNDDIIARLGGDEFAVLLEINKNHKIEKYADNLMDRINAMAMSFDEHNLRINVSIGIYIITAQTRSSNEALELADSACYNAKKRKDLGSQYSFTGSAPSRH